ncbi:MAG: ATP-binding protein [Marinobacterium sp.]|nr:ATP-binding protein [Marinobacterium sp.]
MRIAIQTFLIILGCLLGGLALYSAVWFKFTELEQLRDQNQQNQLAMRDVGHLETMFNQWFVTIDLFFSQQQSYLAAGIARQANELGSTLTELQDIAPAEAPTLKQHLHQINALVQRAARFPPAQNNQWPQQLRQSDEASGLIVEQMDNLYNHFGRNLQLSQSAMQLAEQNLMPRLASYVAAYVVLVLLIWAWATRTLVRPLQQLHRQARRPLKKQQQESFRLHHGPYEIRRLSQSFNRYSERLFEAVHQAEKERRAAEKAQAATESIMHAAPDAIITISPRGEILNMNRTTYDMFELPLDKDTESHIRELIPLLSDEEISIAAGNSSEHTGETRSNRKFPLELNAAPLDNEHNGYTLIVRDITQRKVQELKVQKLNQKLVAASRQAGIAEIATGILHNVGNVLNSVTTSVSLLQNQVSQSSTGRVSKISGLLQQHSNDLPTLFTPGNKGAQLPDYLSGLDERLQQEQQQQQQELDSLSKNIAHIAEIIASQQKFAGHNSVIEPLDLAEVLDDALAMHSVQIRSQGIDVVRNFSATQIQSDRHSLMQIFVNLVRNACEAIAEQNPNQPRLTLSVDTSATGLAVDITDNGTGLNEDQKHNLFRHGFTTKSSGHGFGLHSCALTAKNMQGQLQAHSDGPGQGCTFSLQLPVSVMEHAA